MVGWHHQLCTHEFEETLGNGEGQRSLGAAVHGVAKSQRQLSDSTTAATDNLFKVETCALLLWQQQIPWYKQFSLMSPLSLQNSKDFQYWSSYPSFPAISGHLGCDWKVCDFMFVILRAVKTRITANGLTTSNHRPAAQSFRRVQCHLSRNSTLWQVLEPLH